MNTPFKPISTAPRVHKKLLLLCSETEIFIGAWLSCDPDLQSLLPDDGDWYIYDCIGGWALSSFFRRPAIGWQELPELVVQP